MFQTQRKPYLAGFFGVSNGRGKLKSFLILLIYIKNNNLKLLPEYQLEYRSTGRYSPRSVV